MYCKKPPLFFSLYLFLFASSYQSYGNMFSDCSSTDIVCGSTFTISYPFRLKGMPYYCGHPKFEVQCTQNKSLEIYIAGKPYGVSSIRYDKQFLGVANHDYLISEACPHTYSNTSLDFLLYNYFSNAINVTLFFNCSRPSANRNVTRVPCLSNMGDSRDSYYSLPEGVDNAHISEYTKNCKSIVLIPIYDNMVGYLRNDFLKVLQGGFGLSWIVGNGWCGDCIHSGGVCGNNPKKPNEQVCFCSDGSAASGACPEKKRNLGVVLGVVSGVGVLILLGTCLGLFLSVCRKRKLKPNSSGLSSKMDPHAGETNYNTHIFSYDELEEATHGFDESRKLGRGGFGAVYKGKLRDGRTVAVKRLYENNCHLDQFLNEIKILSRLRHQNLVTLYGCTSRHSRELLLVYEYIPNGTVADHLHGSLASKGGLSWPICMSIGIQTAEALSYLHSIEPQIIHRDIKTTNILLDNNFQVKVADFGISRLFPLDGTHVSTRPQGTFGYFDPEYFLKFQLTDKSDVYSFGVLLLELISSKPAVDVRRHTDEINLANMAMIKIQMYRIVEFVDPNLGYESDLKVTKMIDQVVELAVRCLQSGGEMRPGMKEVLHVLRCIKDEVDGDVMDSQVKEESKLLTNVATFSPDSVKERCFDYNYNPHVATL